MKTTEFKATKGQTEEQIMEFLQYLQKHEDLELCVYQFSYRLRDFYAQALSPDDYINVAREFVTGELAE